MRLKIPKMFAAAIFAAFLFAFLFQGTHATTVLQMSLDELASRADRVFRGSVLSAEPGSVAFGSGSLPSVTYELLVEEQFKGNFPSGPGKVIVTITMVGNDRGGKVVNGAQHLSVLPELPELRVGAEYVLFTTQPSSGGLSTTVGLGQGAFKISASPEGEELAANELNNVGLFSGPVSYSTLASAIRAALN